MNSSEIAVELANVTKEYGKVVALNNVTMRVKKGTIHCLVGENGAGKTTLVNVLYGMVQPDLGEIRADNNVIQFHSPAEAIHFGLGCVHQEFMLAPTLTVTENIIAGKLPRDGKLYSIKSAGKFIKELSEKYGFELDPFARIQNLSIGEMQAVELLKALYRGAEVLILDEPTAVLTPGEVKKLFSTLKKLKSQGKTIIFITHKLDEVMEIADWVTVLRLGKVTGDFPVEEITIPKLVELMVGKEIELNIQKPNLEPGEEILKVDDIEIENDRGVTVVRGFSLALHTNEILSIAGVEGNGQVELVEALIGLRHIKKGQIIYRGRPINKLTPRERREAGIAFIPENRLRHGTSVRCTVQENLTSLVYYKQPYSNHDVLNLKALNDFSSKLIKKYDIRVPNPGFKVRSLSGGNIQRLIIARELVSDPPLLIASQPTRGLDIASTTYIHKQLVESRGKGAAVLVVSADLNEVLDISDRIVVMYKGRNVQEFSGKSADIDKIGIAMTGGKS